VVTLADLTVSHGLIVNMFGGGIKNEGILTLNRSIVDNNSTSNTTFEVGHGGGIYNSGTLTLNDTMVTNNQIISTGGAHDNHGAGLYNDLAAVLHLNRSVVSYNDNCCAHGNHGAGITNNGGTLEVTDSTVTHNTAGQNTGGIWTVSRTGHPAITQVARSTVSFNSGGTVGSCGGVMIQGQPQTGSLVTIVNSTVSGNVAPNDAGGICATEGQAMAVSFSTITNNRAGGSGGGFVVNAGARLELNATVVADNTASSGPDCLIAATFTSIGHNLIANTAGCNYPLAGNDLLNIAPLLGSLQDNGGPTETQALLAGSPAIDTIPEGSNGCGTDITTDQRGIIRPQGASCDIGAFEVEAGFTFSGFFPPVVNPPVLNVVKAGSAIPMKFSLDGDQGLNIFASGYPRSRQITCDTSVPVNDIVDETVTPGESGLTYDASTDQYTYVWKTNKNWAGTCRQFIMRLTDGSDHAANFQFK
jgi:hypothetical protein